MKQIVTLDSHKIRIYLICPEMYNIAHEQNLRKVNTFPVDEKHRYMDKGTLVHKLMDTYYNLRALNPRMNAMEHGTAALKFFQSTKLFAQSGFSAEWETLVSQRFIQYIIKYSTFEYNPLIRNGVPSVEVGFAKKIYEDDNYIFIIDGRIDLLAHADFGNFFIDHKTQERKSELYEQKIQFCTYSLATGFNYGGVNYFGLQKKYEEKETLRRDFFYIPQWKIEQFKGYIIEKVFKPIAERRAEDARRRLSGVRKDQWEMSLNSCSGPDEKRRCELADICETEHVETRDLIKRQFFQVVPAWSPWD